MRQLVALACLFSLLSGCASTTVEAPAAAMAGNAEADNGYCFQLIVCPLVGAVDFASE